MDRFRISFPLFGRLAKHNVILVRRFGISSDLFGIWLERFAVSVHLFDLSVRRFAVSFHRFHGSSRRFLGATVITGQTGQRNGPASEPLPHGLNRFPISCQPSCRSTDRFAVRGERNLPTFRTANIPARKSQQSEGRASSVGLWPTNKMWQTTAVTDRRYSAPFRFCSAGL